MNKILRKKYNKKRHENIKSINTILRKTIDGIDDLFNNGMRNKEFQTGFSELDQLSGGIDLGDCLVVASRPSVGGSLFAINMALNIAKNKKYGIGFFNMETSDDFLTKRMLSSLSCVDMKKIREAKLDEDDWSRLTSAVTVLNSLDIYIDDTNMLGLSDLLEHIIWLNRQHNTKLFVIDSISLLDNKKNKDIPSYLKKIAHELGVTIIFTSGLKRSVDKRKNCRPRLSDLRKKKSIINSCHYIILLYRDEIYSASSDEKNVLEVSITSFKYHCFATIKLIILAQFQRIINLHKTIDGNYDEYEFNKLYKNAVIYILTNRDVSISSLQRKLNVGSDCATQILMTMENEGLISPQMGSGSRMVL